MLKLGTVLQRRPAAQVEGSHALAVANVTACMDKVKKKKHGQVLKPRLHTEARVPDNYDCKRRLAGRKLKISYRNHASEITRERERDGRERGGAEGETDRQTETDRDRQTETERVRERDTHTEIQRQRPRPEEPPCVTDRDTKRIRPCQRQL